MRRAWLCWVLSWCSCQCLQATDELDVAVDAGRPSPRPDAAVVVPPVLQPACVAFPTDAGDCDAGWYLFDGTTCRRGCAPPVAADASVFARELDCVLACQCDQSKFNAAYKEETQCDWLYLFTSGPIDWDAGTCQLPPGSTACTAWTGTAVGRGTGSPLFEDGVRLACEASLKPQVSKVYCDVWLE